MEEKLKEIEKIIEEWQMGLHSSEAMSKIEKIMYPQLEKPDYKKIADNAAKNTR